MDNGVAEGRPRLRKEASAALWPQVVGLPGAEMASRVNELVIMTHAEEAAFLATQRALAVEQPHYNLAYLARLDERVDAHIDGLVTAGQRGREACSELVKAQEPGAFFAACVVDQLGSTSSRLINLAEQSLGDGQRRKEFAAACRWLQPEEIARPLRDLCRASDPVVRATAVLALAEARVNPEGEGSNVLAACVKDVDDRVRAFAIYAAGLLLQRQLRLDLDQHLIDSSAALSEEERFLAAYGGALIDLSAGTNHIRHVVRTPDDPHAVRGMRILMTRLPDRELEPFLDEISEFAPALELIGVGMAGRLPRMERIFDAMKDKDLARLAGEAYATITGADLELEDLDGETLLGEDEDEDDKLILSYQTDLPWPSAPLILKHWSSAQLQLVPGHRYLCGSPVDAGCLSALTRGYQRQRALAALHLARRTETPMLFDIAEPVRRQMARLRA